jgi:pyruvate-ferredoxin/flavodoxin oxidoreductase
VIRAKYYEESRLAGAPAGFRSLPLTAVGVPDTRYTLQVYAEDCTGCALCVEACPAQAPLDPDRKAINLAPAEPLLDRERENIAFFETIPVNDRARVDFGTVRGAQYLQPLFEFSGACAGCGETRTSSCLAAVRRPADGRQRHRLLVDLRREPPHDALDDQRRGRGPAWSNSLFEDNAEFGLGFRLAADLHETSPACAPRSWEELGADLVDAVLDAPQLRESELRAQRERVAELRRRVGGAR